MTAAPTQDTGRLLSWGEPRATWVLVATVLGSALAFIDATVVNIALPDVGEDLDGTTAALTWVVNGYTLTLAALVLLGGALGDRLGRRRVFLVGVVVFATASAACGLAPNLETLVAARALQGVGGALLTPTSLAILQASFSQHDRGRAIGAWSGLTGVAGAIGPFAGGWLVQEAGWRWVFLVNLPVALVVVLIARRHVPETRDPVASGRLDLRGAALLALGLAGLTYGLSASSEQGLGAPAVLGAFAAGGLLLAAFVVAQQRTETPLLPLGVFASRLFLVTNVVTFVLYGAMGAVFFALVVALQVGAGFSPLASGLAMLPVTILMLLFSSAVGGLMKHTGPRPLMAIGPLLSAVGVALLSRVGPGSSYLLDVLVPTTIFGVGLTLLVTPLTATVLAALPDEQAGLASGVNNAVARAAGLLSVAAIPVVAGLGSGGLTDPTTVLDGFVVVTWVCAALLALGGVLAGLFITTPRSRAAEPGHPEVAHRHCAAMNGPPIATPAESEAAA